MLAHPELPSCEDCQRLWYYFKDGALQITEDGKGSPRPRPKEMDPPCAQCPKIPKGEFPCPDNAMELSHENWAAVVYYLEVKAGNVPVGDPVARRNCALIRHAEDRHERNQMGTGGRLLNTLTRLAAVQPSLKVRGRS